MTQLDLFPRVFYINLDSRPDRRVQTEAELARVGLKAARVPGVRLEPADEIAIRRLGCSLSHLGIIKAAKRDRLDCVLILEDDVTFAPNFAAAAKASIADLRRVEWDLFYLGYESFGYQHGALRPVTPRLARTESMYLTHCYAVHSRAYDTVIQLVLNARIGDTIDGLFVHNADRFRVYCSVPKLAFQRPGHSDIENRDFPSGR